MSGNESIDAAHYDQVTTWPRGGLQADIVHIGFWRFSSRTPGCLHGSH
ncbi:oxidoreductase ydfI [Escherichia coli]|uniref:Oxidoreductase ydfI n=1 Tax=Escherichia coli TaxID=562 RepID=A0A377K033_ECOLX|nr:oxidoreductase ydfI [Escherichia coli]